MEDIELITKRDLPYCIRDTGGILVFFPDVCKWEGQDERYKNDCDKQCKIADHLVESLKSMKM